MSQKTHPPADLSTDGQSTDGQSTGEQSTGEQSSSDSSKPNSEILVSLEQFQTGNFPEFCIISGSPAANLYAANAKHQNKIFSKIGGKIPLSQQVVDQLAFIRKILLTFLVIGILLVTFGLFLDIKAGTVAGFISFIASLFIFLAIKTRLPVFIFSQQDILIKKAHPNFIQQLQTHKRGKTKSCMSCSSCDKPDPCETEIIL